MMGAAVANLIAMFIYNTVRFTFIWKKFGLQPFGWKNLALLVSGSALILIVFFIPSLANLFIDGVLRSLIFIILFGLLIIKGNFSEEINTLWQKWFGKIATGFNKK